MAEAASAITFACGTLSTRFCGMVCTAYLSHCKGHPVFCEHICAILKLVLNLVTGLWCLLLLLLL